MKYLFWGDTISISYSGRGLGNDLNLFTVGFGLLFPISNSSFKLFNFQYLFTIFLVTNGSVLGIRHFYLVLISDKKKSAFQYLIIYTVRRPSYRVGR